MSDDIEIFRNFSIVVGTLALVPAWLFEWRRRRRHPNTLSFAWGYWCSLRAIGAALFSFLYFGTETKSLEGWTLSVIGFLEAICGVLMFYRMRLAWIVWTVLSLNPLIWLINSFYLRKRWRGMVDRPFRSYKPGDQAIPEIASSYIVHDGDTQSGPFTLMELQERVKGGRIPAIAYFWYAGVTDWLPIEDLPMEVVSVERPIKPNPVIKAAFTPPEQRRRAGADAEVTSVSKNPPSPAVDSTPFIRRRLVWSMVPVALWLVVGPPSCVSKMANNKEDRNAWIARRTVFREKVKSSSPKVYVTATGNTYHTFSHYPYRSREAYLCEVQEHLAPCMVCRPPRIKEHTGFAEQAPEERGFWIEFGGLFFALIGHVVIRWPSGQVVRTPEHNETSQT